MIDLEDDLRPQGDHVLIEEQGAETVTESGLHIPETGQERPTRGTVLAVGPGKRSESGVRLPMDVAEGDEVIYGKYSGTQVSEEPKRILVKQANLYAVIE